ncbi:MAG: hypothetical protein KZQ99_14240 [Candidatus Thiodiazotropha sp. (ex Dulcina madagascariensis)]|nr:hypothetical protein [Candidatus Thiodiazotropha sp. (ex Dulcina madagascariensis)]
MQTRGFLGCSEVDNGFKSEDLQFGYAIDLATLDRLEIGYGEAGLL